MQLNLSTGGSALEMFLRDAGGITSAVVGTMQGEARAATGSAGASDEVAAVTASLAIHLEAAGAALGMGSLSVASLKSAQQSHLFAVRAGATLALTVDGGRPLGDLESKLSSGAWNAPEPPPPPSGELAAGSGQARLSAINPRLVPPPASVKPPVRATIPLPASASPPRQALEAPMRPGGHGPPPPPPPVRSGAITKPRQAVADPSEPKDAAGAFSGDLDELELPDLLEFMRNGQRTGALTCTSQRRTGWVHLSRGMIVGADAPNAGDLRGHLLVLSEVTEAQRRLIAAMPNECFSDDSADLALVSQSVVSAEILHAARVAHVYSAFREMLRWTTGRFSFDPTAPIRATSTLSLSPQSVLLHLYQEQDEKDR